MFSRSYLHLVVFSQVFNSHWLEIRVWAATEVIPVVQIKASSVLLTVLQLREPEPFFIQGHLCQYLFNHVLCLFPQTDTFRRQCCPAWWAPDRCLCVFTCPGLPGRGLVWGVCLPQWQGLPLPCREQLHLPGCEQHLPLELTWKHPVNTGVPDGTMLLVFLELGGLHSQWYCMFFLFFFKMQLVILKNDSKLKKKNCV